MRDSITMQAATMSLSHNHCLLFEAGTIEIAVLIN